MRPFLAALVLVVTALATPATAAPKGGWVSPAGPAGSWGNAQAACQAQHDRLAQSSPGPIEAANLYWSISNINASCNWTTHLDGPPGRYPVNSLPVPVMMICPDGYDGADPAVCVPKDAMLRPSEPCGGNFGGTPSPATPNPVDIATGAKFLLRTDVSMGALRFGRNYRAHWGSDTVVRTKALGFGGSIRHSLEWTLSLVTWDMDHEVHVTNPWGGGNKLRLKPDFTLGPLGGAYDIGGRFSFNGAPGSGLNDVIRKGGRFTLTFASGETIVMELYRPDPNSTFYSRGRPVEIRYADGTINRLTYASGTELTSIADAFGRTITVEWATNSKTGAAARISGLLLPDGSRVRYTYETVAGLVPGNNAEIRLKKVETLSADGAVIDSETYHYENGDWPYALTGLTDNRGVRVATFAYDDTGRVASTEKAGGVERYAFSYARLPGSPWRVQTTVTNPLGKQTVYTFTENWGRARLVSVDGVASSNCVASNATYAYDSRNLMTSMTDEEGRVTTRVSDDAGRPVSITRGSGATSETTRFAFTPDGRLSEVRRPSMKTTYTWEDGRLSAVEEIDTTASPQAVRRTAYAYGPEGLLAAVDGPLPGPADTTRFAYTAEGYLRTVTTPMGHVTTATSWNGRGQPLRVVDANGLVVDYLYDGLGRIVPITQDPGATQAVWTIDYDAAGNVARTGEPSGAFLLYAYDDAGRLSKVTNAFGQTITYTRNALGQATAIVARTGGGAPSVSAQRTRVFDELGRLIRQVNGAAPASRWTWDRSGLPVTAVDPRGGTVTHGYDALARLVTRTAEDGGVETLTRGADGEVSAYGDPKGLVTTFERNGYGEVVRSVSPDRGTWTYGYDERGLMVRRTDGRGVVTTWSYDAAGRPTAMRFPASPAEDVVYRWDETAGGNRGVGRLTGMTDASGASAWTYDAKGRVIRETRTVDGRSASIGYGFDAAGLLREVTYPSGRVVSYGYDGMGRIASMATRRPGDGADTAVVHWTSYEPFGPLNAMAFGNGLVWYTYFDQAGFPDVIGVSDPDGSNPVFRRFHSHDGVNLTALNDALDDGQDVWMDGADGYDAANRLTKAAQVDGGVFRTRRYSYDLAGNRIGESITPAGGAPVARSYAYAPGTNRLAAITSAGSTLRSFSYDGAGNVVSDTRAGVVFSYAYDALGRLTMTRQGGTPVGLNVYDGMSRLARRSVAGVSPPGTTHTLALAGGGGDFDGLMPGLGAAMGGLGNRIVAEIDDATGATAREYLWLGDRVVAVAPAGPSSATLYFVTTDHLMRPVQMTGASKAVVWRAKYGPFGELLETTGPASLSARYPGQWFQLENGLAWNWHRHYDASLGRYVQPDPLGLVDGPSVYGYVRQNPVMGVDPEGLTSQVKAPTLGAPRMSASVFPSPGGGARIASGASSQMCQSKPDKNMCIAICTEITLPTPDYGVRFQRCLSHCMGKAYWPEFDGLF